MSTTAVTSGAEHLIARDRELLIHPYLPGLVSERVVMTEGSGCRLRDVDDLDVLQRHGARRRMSEIGEPDREAVSGKGYSSERATPGPFCSRSCPAWRSCPWWERYGASG